MQGKDPKNVFYFAGNSKNPFQAFSMAEDDVPDDYPQYPLTGYVPAEKMILRNDYRYTAEKTRAFTIGNQAETAFRYNKLDDCNKLAMQSWKMDASMIDAYRSSILGFKLFLDNDAVTKICAMREVLYFSRFYFQDIIRNKTPNFYDYALGRPYLRCLSALGSFAEIGQYRELRLQAYEEHLRLCPTDNTSARHSYTAAYLDSVIGTKRGDDTFPKRTPEQLMQIFTEKIYPGEDFSLWATDSELKNERFYNYSKILLKYVEKDQQWQTLAKAEAKRDPQFVKFILFEEDLNCNPNDPFDKNGFYYSDYNLLMPVFIREVKFLPDFARVVRGRVNEMVKLVPTAKKDLNPNKKISGWKSKAETALNKARDYMRSRKFVDGIKALTEAKELYDSSIFPSTRWDKTEIPFAIFSNRAQCAAQLQMWNLARIDIRCALSINPKIPHLYKLLPFVAENFNCPKMKARFTKLAEEAAQEHVDSWWQAMSAKVVGYLSLRALVGERIGLSEVIIEEETSHGIQDMWTPISFPLDYPLLPWQKPEDLELEIK